MSHEGEYFIYMYSFVWQRKCCAGGLGLHILIVGGASYHRSPLDPYSGVICRAIGITCQFHVSVHDCNTRSWEAIKTAFANKDCSPMNSSNLKRCFQIPNLSVFLFLTCDNYSVKPNLYGVELPEPLIHDDVKTWNSLRIHRLLGG